MLTEDWTTELSTIPTLVDLEIAMRRVQNGKAIGPDRVPGEACKHHATEMAIATYAQALKLLAHSQEAWLHKGGLLVTAYKGRGPMDVCSSFRSLLISSHVGKTVRRTLRQLQYTTYEHWLHHTQIGGRKAFPAGAGVHVLRSYLRWKAHCNTSCAVVFVDFQEAFYRVLRPLVVGSGYSDETLAAIAARFGLSRTAFEELQGHLREPCAARRAGLLPHHCRALEALHDSTWFRLCGQKDFVRTEVGTRR